MPCAPGLITFVPDASVAEVDVVDVVVGVVTDVLADVDADVVAGGALRAFTGDF